MYTCCIKKQEVELQFCGSEGWVKDIYSGYTCTALHETHEALHETHEALHEAHVLQQTDANFMNDEEDGEGSEEGLLVVRSPPWHSPQLSSLLKGHCHAIWQLYKKLGIFASIEFQN